MLMSIRTRCQTIYASTTIVVDPGNRLQLRRVRCIRHHLRKRYSARKPCEENLVHSAVQSAVDLGGWHVVFKQLRVFDLVGALFLQRPPGDFRFTTKAGQLLVGLSTSGSGEFGGGCASNT